MCHECTKEAFEQVRNLRTRYPWAVVNTDMVVVAVFNYRDEAKALAKTDPRNLVAYNAAGVVFGLVKDCLPN